MSTRNPPPIHLKHGHAKGFAHTKVYSAWHQMKSRCLNPKNPGFQNYGGRGITVCQRWANSFEAFYEDMGDPPAGFSIDRINNDGNYEPGNCRWASTKTQANNTRSNAIVEFAGVSKSVACWASELGIKPNTLLYRIRRGWTSERAFAQPVQRRCHDH